MKIIVLVPKLHAGAELALNKLLREKRLEIVALVRSDISPINKNYWKYVRYGLRKAGVFYGALIALLAYLHLFALPIIGLFYWNRRRKWLTIDKLVERHNLKIHDTENINSEETIAWIRNLQPEVMVSLYFDQILKEEVIAVPTIAALNMHPGLLPKYRGIWPEFWNLLNNEKFAGVSVHHLKPEIDAGAVVAQKKYPIGKSQTKFSLALQSAKHGAQLLIKTLTKMKNGVSLIPLKSEGKPKYYSLPTKEHFDSFFARGKKLFSILGLWRDFKKMF